MYNYIYIHTYILYWYLIIIKYYQKMRLRTPGHSA